MLAVIGGFLVMGVGGALTQWLQPDFNNEIQQTTEEITKNVSSVAGAVFFGLGAGASEETLLRGADPAPLRHLGYVAAFCAPAQPIRYFLRAWPVSFAWV